MTTSTVTAVFTVFTITIIKHPPAMQSSTFTLAAEPNTDIWKKPPSHDVFTGPSTRLTPSSCLPNSLLSSRGRKHTKLTRLLAPFRPHSKRPISRFLSATLTFSAAYSLQYDQAGILLVFTNKHDPGARKWIKAGIELFDGVARLSTVCCDAWADWSVATAPDEGAVAAGRRPVTLRIEAHRETGGASLWVFHVVDGDGGGSENGKQNPMREVCWPFGDAASDNWELEVSAVVARPAEAKGKLEATFENFDVRWNNE